MIEVVRRRFALRDLRAAVARRSPRPLPPDPRERTLLLVLPGDEAGQRAAWALVSSLALPERHVIPVLVGEHMPYAPDRYAGAIRLIGDGERDWRRLPNAAARQSVWTQRPDVALNLAAPDDLGAALLAGASPAAIRIGRHHPEREALYDLMIQSAPDAASVAAALDRVLRQLDPPVLPV